MTEGLVRKFRVSKFVPATPTSGPHYAEVKDFTFVLRPKNDPAAIEALRAYAVAVAHTNPRLAWDLVAQFPELQPSVIATGCAMPDCIEEVTDAPQE
jgi:hypothetical protein